MKKQEFISSKITDFFIKIMENFIHNFNSICISSDGTNELVSQLDPVTITQLTEQFNSLTIDEQVQIAQLLGNAIKKMMSRGTCKPFNFNDIPKFVC